jgi:hypothetical protein
MNSRVSFVFIVHGLIINIDWGFFQPFGYYFKGRSPAAAAPPGDDERVAKIRIAFFPNYNCHF